MKETIVTSYLKTIQKLLCVSDIFFLSYVPTPITRQSNVQNNIYINRHTNKDWFEKKHQYVASTYKD